MKKNSDILYIIFADLISPYIVETLKMKKSDILTKFWDSFCSKIVPKNSQKLFQTLFDPKTLLKNKDIQPEDIEMLLYSMRFCFKTILVQCIVYWRVVNYCRQSEMCASDQRCDT